MFLALAGMSLPSSAGEVVMEDRRLFAATLSKVHERIRPRPRAGMG